MKRVLAIVFSDLHINDWSKFNQDNKRTQDHFRVLYLIRKACIKYGCPALFCGDLLHKPENLSLELASQIFPAFDSVNHVSDFEVYGISGNHDLTQRVKIGDKPTSWLNVLADRYNFLNSLDFTSKDIHTHNGAGSFTIWGVPYIDHNIGLNDYLKNLKFTDGFKNILLLHTDYPGAKDTDGSEVGTSENLNLNILNRFDLVLCGHIHKPQRLSKKVYMIGAPIQQRRTDKDCDMGYWKLYEDLSMVFVPLSDKFPRFIDVSSPEEVKEDGNYYTVISSKVLAMDTVTNPISKKLSKKRMVKRYLKAKNITDKKKESILLDIIKESEDD